MKIKMRMVEHHYFIKIVIGSNRKLSKKFLAKYKSNRGVFPDIDLIDYNFSFSNDDEYKQVKLENGDGDINHIEAYKINNKFIYYLYEVFYDENGYIDDIIYTKLPYENMSIDEVKVAYLKNISK